MKIRWYREENLWKFIPNDPDMEWRRLPYWVRHMWHWVQGSGFVCEGCDDNEKGTYSNNKPHIP